MNNKRRIILSVIGVVISITLLIISSFLIEGKILNPAIAYTFMAISAVLVISAILYAAKVDYETGIYECRKCGHKFKPTFKSYICGVHSLTTRHLKCPECGKKSMCRRKMSQ